MMLPRRGFCDVAEAFFDEAIQSFGLWYLKFIKVMDLAHYEISLAGVLFQNGVV
jgi:hypothetical protein